MKRLRRLIPSMFHRRLALLAIGGVAVVGGLGAQTASLTLTRHHEMLAAAESHLVSERLTPTVRGRILDRKGRVLAEERATFDVLIDYRLLTGEWAYSRAARRARDLHAEDWSKLDRKGREDLIAEQLPAYTDRLERFSRELAGTVGVSVEILDERAGEVRRHVQRTATSVWERWLVARREELNRGRELATEIEVTLADVNKPIREQRQSHALLTGLTEEQAFEVRRLLGRYTDLHLRGGTPGVQLEAGGARSYPLETVDVEVMRDLLPQPLRDADDSPTRVVTVGGLLTRSIGWMREAQSEDIAARSAKRRDMGLERREDLERYLAGDLVGGRGIEATQEERLRGARGSQSVRLDTGETEIIEPIAGEDVRLTIDAMLQARVRAIMDPDVGLARVQPWHATRQGLPMPEGTELYGAAAVLDVSSGDVLALVSTPSFTREQARTEPDRVWNDALRAPWVDRAVAKPYPPGSIIKPLVFVAAVTQGTHALYHDIVCTGALNPERPNRLRCWIFKQNQITHFDQFGEGLRGDMAISVSCNVFFYTVARGLGVDAFDRWMRAFGAGDAFGLGIGPELEGIVGERVDGTRTGLGDTIQMGIGQGPIAWSPLHAADTYATLARGGIRIVPRVLRDDAPRATDLGLDRDAIDMAMRGLELAVTDRYGTGSTLKYPDGSSEPTFNVPGVRVWGKTGTAQAPDLLGEDPDGDGPERRPVLRTGDHSWFVVLAGPEGGAPRYAIAVVMEYAGSGGRVSGPIANQIVRALRDEGYL